MLSFLVCLPTNQNVGSKEKSEIILNVMTIFMVIGEKMPSKVPGLHGLLGGIELVINALSDTSVITDQILGALQKCKLVKDHETVKKKFGEMVRFRYIPCRGPT